MSAATAAHASRSARSVLAWFRAASTAIEEPGLFLYFPRRAAETPKLWAFIDVAREVSKAKV